MSGVQQDGAMAADGSPLNGTAALGHNQETDSALLEFKVFDIVIIALALCILFITGLYYITVCYNRSRQSKRARVYESAVTRAESLGPVQAVRAVKRSTSFINPLAFLRRAEAAKDNSRIYYIYSNPLPVGLKEDEEEAGSKAPEERAALSFQERANDPKGGVVRFLEPPVFYMQL